MPACRRWEDSITEDVPLLPTPTPEDADGEGELARFVEMLHQTD
jgi:hypothetical protein